MSRDSRTRMRQESPSSGILLEVLIKRTSCPSKCWVLFIYVYWIQGSRQSVVFSEDSPTKIFVPSGKNVKRFQEDTARCQWIRLPGAMTLLEHLYGSAGEKPRSSKSG